VNRVLIGKLVLAVLLSAAGAFAQEQKPQPFSSDFKITSPSGQEIMTGRVYFAWPKLRQDVKDVQHGVTAYTIVDYSNGTAIAMLPRSHSYMETHLDQQNRKEQTAPPIQANFNPKDPCAGHEGWNCKKSGAEKVGGRTCDVWEISNQNGRSTEWIDSKLNFPIKYKNADGYVLEYTNIQENQQPAPSLFEVPQGYQKMGASSPLK
jgi:outer membrane lipoprotein-sorting protein